MGALRRQYLGAAGDLAIPAQARPAALPAVRPQDADKVGAAPRHAHLRQAQHGDTPIPVWKRVLDVAVIVAAAPGLILAGGLIALVIKLGSRGPIFFRQRRVGYKGNQFLLYKFRTMKTDADTGSHERHTQELIQSNKPMVKLDARKDPRLVPLARTLRATGLDELPQLINVLRGEMSLVGPRPCLPYEYEVYKPWQRKRCDAVPGLTGLWQVSGKNRTTFEEMVRLDIDYAKRMSWWLDVQILFKTLPALWKQFRELRPESRSLTT